MATLELEFNCLCLFVPDPNDEVVHVLMPGTDGHPDDHDDGHAEHGKHVVRMLHRSFKGDEKLRGRPLEGWALTLGPETPSPSAVRTLGPKVPSAGRTPPSKTAPASRTLVSHGDRDSEGELPDLSDITGRTVDPALLGLNPGSRVAARITLRTGRATRLAYESTWRIENDATHITRDIRIAHQVTWRMEHVDPTLIWSRLSGRSNGDYAPLESLNALEPEDDLSYRLRIFHVTEDALPPRGGILKPAEMRQHYRAFYSLLGENHPADGLLPRITEKHILDVNCGGAMAQPRPGG